MLFKGNLDRDLEVDFLGDCLGGINRNLNDGHVEHGGGNEE